MKYRLLSKEQFESLHKEFSTFLATQGIDKKAWELAKDKSPKKVVSQLEKFSDMVWEDVLSKSEYLEHYSKDSLNLFYCKPKSVERIVIRIEKEGINLQGKEGFDWFIDNSNDASIHYFRGEKPYTTTRNEELFKLIEQGALLANNNLFDAVKQVISPAK